MVVSFAVGDAFPRPVVNPITTHDRVERNFTQRKMGPGLG